MENKKNYFIGIGTIDSLRLIGPFSRKITAENYVKKNEKHVFFNPFKEQITLYVSQNPKFYLKNAEDLFYNVLQSDKIVDIRDYKK